MNTPATTPSLDSYMGTPDAEVEALSRALVHTRAYLAGLASSRVTPSLGLEALRARLRRPLPAEGVEASRVVDDLVRDTSGGLLGSAGGRFFAWVIGGTLPAALAADWLTSAWDQNAAICATSPAVAVIEEACGDWLKQLLGLPAASSFAMTTGSQMAHLVALAAARHALLARIGWDVEERGLSGAPAIRLFASDQRHGSVERAARLLGLGRRSLIALPSDGDGRLGAGTLRAALDAAPGAPTVVVLQAGDLNAGAFDDFSTLVPLAHERGAWVHVDGAFGLWASCSAAHRAKVAGAERADSWVSDGHKWLNVPYDCGYVFVADPRAHAAAVSHRESYLVETAGGRDPIDWGPEWSRRGRGVATYAALRQLGRRGVAELVDRTCELARALVDGLGALPGTEVVWRPQLNQGLVRFLDPRPDAVEADHDRRTDAVIAAVAEGGEAYFGGTAWRGRRCMRVSVCNWRTTAADVAQAVSAVARALER